NRGQVEGVAFHERKALAYQEKMNARKRMTKHYDGEVPDYAESLKEAVEQYKQVLQTEDTPFNQKSLEKIADLEKHYNHKIYNRGKMECIAFHERKALAYQEKMNERKRMTKHYDGEVPDYAESLKEAVEQYKQVLQTEDTPFNQKSLEKIADLEKHYYHKIYNA